MGFIEDFQPTGDAAYEVGQAFRQLLKQHSEALRQQYGVARSNEWPADPLTMRWAPPGADTKLAYVFYEKMWPELQEDLVQTGLAVPERNADPRWVGMHPRLANVYMMALAEEIAAGNGLHPTTDEELDHAVVSGATLERVAQALLGNVQLAPKGISEQETAAELASIAVQAAVPKNIDALDVDKIIEVRKKHRPAMARFQEFIQERAKELNHLQRVDDLGASRSP